MLVFHCKMLVKESENAKKSHVVGAVHWDLNDDLSDITKEDGRQPMPDKELLDELFRSKWPLT